MFIYMLILIVTCRKYHLKECLDSMSFAQCWINLRQSSIQGNSKCSVWSQKIGGETVYHVPTTEKVGGDAICAHEASDTLTQPSNSPCAAKTNFTCKKTSSTRRQKHNQVGKCKNLCWFVFYIMYYNLTSSSGQIPISQQFLLLFIVNKT